MTAIPAPESGPFQINPAPAPVVGWIVLTEQADRTWLPDWDGRLHTDRDQADEQAAIAADMLDQAVQLAEVRGVLA